MQVPTDVKFNYFDAEGNMQDISVEDLTKGKKVQTQSCNPAALLASVALWSDFSACCTAVS